MAAPLRTAADFLRHVLFSARSAAEAVANNKLRAGLTSLGILFGVASVIAMLAIGRGAEQEILEQMRLLGANNVVVTPAKEQQEGDAGQEEEKEEPKRFSPGLTVLDARSIASVVPNVAATSGEIVLNTTLTREGYRRSGKLVGVDTAYLRLQNLRLAEGSPFSPAQVRAGAPVAIIGHGVRTRFFAKDPPIGGRLKVGDVWLTVVGVLEDRKVTGDIAQRLGIHDGSMDVFVPLNTTLLRYRDRARVTGSDIERASRAEQQSGNSEDAGPTDEAARAERRNYHQLDKLIVHVDEAAMVPAVAELLQRVLLRRHNDVVDFEITVPELLLQQEQRTKTIFNVVLGAIASISLVVGGIGIMNIMLASVLERIREIGVRRAVGATQKDVLAQFLGEAVMISLAGGLAGIFTGALLAVLIERFAGIQTIVSSLSVVVAFGVSVAVGLLFGIVPAWRAAKQDPVVCLRYE